MIIGRLLRWSAVIAVAVSGTLTGAALSAQRPAYGASAPSLPGSAPERKPAKGMFLIASRQLADPNFAQTVVLLLEYDDSGALGLIINRPTRLRLDHLLPDVEELETRTDIVYEGGPVARQQVLLLLRSPRQPPDSGRIFADTYVSSSLITLRALAGGEHRDDSFHAFVGYAGWAPGQLDGEVARGDWYISPADEITIFDRDAADTWPDLIKRNGGRWVGVPRSPWSLASDPP